MEAAGLAWIFSPLCRPELARLISDPQARKAGQVPFLLSATLGHHRNHRYCPEGPGHPPASSGDPFWSLLRGRDREIPPSWAARTPPPIHPPPVSQQLPVP